VCYVSFAKEPYKKTNILQKKPYIFKDKTKSIIVGSPRGA